MVSPFISHVPHVGARGLKPGPARKHSRQEGPGQAEAATESQLPYPLFHVPLQPIKALVKKGAGGQAKELEQEKPSGAHFARGHSRGQMCLRSPVS